MNSRDLLLGTALLKDKNTLLRIYTCTWIYSSLNWNRYSSCTVHRQVRVSTALLSIAGLSRAVTLRHQWNPRCCVRINQSRNSQQQPFVKSLKELNYWEKHTLLPSEYFLRLQMKTRFCCLYKLSVFICTSYQLHGVHSRPTSRWGGVFFLPANGNLIQGISLLRYAAVCPVSMQILQGTARTTPLKISGSNIFCCSQTILYWSPGSLRFKQSLSQNTVFLESHRNTPLTAAFSRQADSFQAAQNSATWWYKYDCTAIYDTTALHVI